jgi:peroxiredoxin Q/BCP
MTELRVGDKAPNFTLPDQDGVKTSLADFGRRRVVVYFYPKDDTPGCTTEACQFNDLLAEFSHTDVDVLGISSDDAESHQAFRAKYGLKVRLLGDVDRSVMAAYGAWGERIRNGEKSQGVIRSTFIIGPDGDVLSAWYNVTPDGHAEEVRTALAA